MLTKIDSNSHSSAMSVCTLKKELYTNTRSLPTTLGSGNYGHLGLVMPREEYLAMWPPARLAVGDLEAIPASVSFIMPVVPEPIRHAINAHNAVISLLRTNRDEETNTRNKER
jgi:hypothetical protein